jgi:hypothetical protein
VSPIAPSERVFESGPWQEISTFEADGAVDSRGGALHRVARARKEGLDDNWDDRFGSNLWVDGKMM